MRSRFFHRTDWQAAQKILRGGFKDSTGHYLSSTLHTGVWVSDTPLDENEGARGDTILSLAIDPKLMEEYEWIEEGKGYREFLVPAKLLNEHARVRVHERERRDGPHRLRPSVRRRPKSGL